MINQGLLNLQFPGLQALENTTCGPGVDAPGAQASGPHAGLASSPLRIVHTTGNKHVCSICMTAKLDQGK